MRSTTMPPYTFDSPRSGRVGRPRPVTQMEIMAVDSGGDKSVYHGAVGSYSPGGVGRMVESPLPASKRSCDDTLCHFMHYLAVS